MNLVGPLSKLAKTAKAGATAVKTAPFYSAVDEALANLPRPKGTGAEFLRELSKTPGVKPAEIADRKLAKAFEAKGKMTKEEAIKLAREYPAPKLYESVGQDLTDKQLANKADEIAQTWGYRDYDDLLPEFQRQVDDQLEKMQAQYGDYKLPGGENYREIKMRLPHFSEEDNYKLMELEANQRRTDPAIWNTTGDAYRLRQLQEKKAALGDQYLSSHWKGEPNVLAHMRVSDRVGPDGQKILHVEEIQSDWHQEGRNKGYKIQGGKLTPKEDNRLTELTIMNPEEMTDAQHKELMSLMSRLPLSESETIANKSRVPDAPFKKNWHELAMKRLLNYAADNGYDSIAITPGAEQAKRYNLSSHVDELLYKQNPDGTYQLSAQVRGSGNMLGQAIPVEKLEDYVGKEVAQKIIDNRGQERNLGGNGSVSQPKDVWGSLSGEGLEIGGEGMKGFYDQMLPSYLNQFGKKHGAQVGSQGFDFGGYKVNRDSGSLPFRLESENSPDIISRHATREEAWDEAERLGTKQLHHFPITPTMREELTTKGTPLYQQIGIPTAGVGAASQMEEQPEIKKADGGAVNYNTSPDMSDGGHIIQGTPFKRGGKVNLTTNRDTMLLELSKLKRK